MTTEKKVGAKSFGVNVNIATGGSSKKYQCPLVLIDNIVCVLVPPKVSSNRNSKIFFRRYMKQRIIFNFIIESERGSFV